MNKIKLSVAAVSRALIKAVAVIALVTLASLIGVGGAALWIYGRPATAQASYKPTARSMADEEPTFPKLTPVEVTDEAPSQLTPARYVPSESEIAVVSDTPRYTYVSYNGGRQQAHLRVNTVLTTSVPAPLAPVAAPQRADVLPAQATASSDPASRYITNAEGRVIGIDGTAGAATEADAQEATIANTPPVQPEVRVAAPVSVRKATPVDDTETTSPAAGFSVQSELSSDEGQPALRALPVSRPIRSSRPSMFGASDDFRSFGRN